MLPFLQYLRPICPKCSQPFPLIRSREDRKAYSEQLSRQGFFSTIWPEGIAVKCRQCGQTCKPKMNWSKAIWTIPLTIAAGFGVGYLLFIYIFAPMLKMVLQNMMLLILLVPLALVCGGLIGSIFGLGLAMSGYKMVPAETVSERQRLSKRQKIVIGIIYFGFLGAISAIGTGGWIAYTIKAVIYAVQWALIFSIYPFYWRKSKIGSVLLFVASIAILSLGSYFADWFDTKENGFVTKTYSNGTIYKGEMRRGDYQGKGKLLYSNGDVYEGDFKDGKFDGFGSYQWKGGTRTVGEYKNNKLNGKVKLYYENGDVFEGICKDGLKYCKGTFTGKEQSFVRNIDGSLDWR